MRPRQVEGLIISVADQLAVIPGAGAGETDLEGAPGGPNNDDADQHDADPDAPALLHKYRKFLRNKEIETDKSYKWCPRPGCETPMKPTFAQYMSKKMVCPKCSTEVCTHCGREYHGAFGSCEVRLFFPFLC